MEIKITKTITLPDSLFAHWLMKLNSRLLCPIDGARLMRNEKIFGIQVNDMEGIEVVVATDYEIKKRKH